MKADDLLDVVGEGHDFLVACIVAVLLFPFFLLGLVAKAAKAMCVRQDQDRDGLGAQPASAVGNADLPNTDRNPHQEDTTHDTD